MEDRVDAGLWLQPADAIDSTQSLTWWENACPNRTDLPRKLDEFRYLGISETEVDARWHFRRYPRPGQGILSGQPTLGDATRENDRVPGRAPVRARSSPSPRPWKGRASGDFAITRFACKRKRPGAVQPACCGECARRLPGTAASQSGPGTPAFDDWAWHPALRILYVNTFKRVDA